MTAVRQVVPALFALAAILLAATPAAAQCPNFLCYIDLRSGTQVCNPTAYSITHVDQVRITPPYNPSCDTDDWLAAVVEVNLPMGCTGASVWVQYEGEPEGWVTHLGDSETNNGFAGDSGSAPVGQNAELQVLDSRLTVYSAANMPPVDKLADLQLALEDGAMQFVVENQFVSWGQPYSQLETPSLEKLFFLPPGDPVPPENRTIYVGLNRVILPFDGPNTNRNGCGARRVLITTN